MLKKCVHSVLAGNEVPQDNSLCFPLACLCPVGPSLENVLFLPHFVLHGVSLNCPDEAPLTLVRVIFTWSIIQTLTSGNTFMVRTRRVSQLPGHLSPVTLAHRITHYTPVSSWLGQLLTCHVKLKGGCLCCFTVVCRTVGQQTPPPGSQVTPSHRNLR